MPERTQPQLVSQSGSVLVTVLGFSIALSMAAASLMLVAGNSRNDEDLAFRRNQCSNDAESGLMMGVAWLRSNNPNSSNFIVTSRGWPGNAITLYSNSTFDNGSSVTVTVTDNSPATPAKTVTSRAVKGSEVVQFSWDVDVQPGGTANSPILALTNWRSP